ncbi:MAG: GNAT family N-acetyltransferase [Ktedonobacterales bacterium]|nr:GNAT family N-acetyltransferase [Ktedonobacterales bacterium]
MTTRVLSLAEQGHERLGDAVEHAWCAAWASLGYDGTTHVEDSPQLLRVVTPTSHDLLLNAILRYRGTAPVTRAEVEAALAPHRAVCRPPQWWLRLGSEPTGLRDRLYEVGMRVWGTPTGMALPLVGVPVAPPLEDAELVLGRARRFDDVEAALHIITEVFDLDAAPMRRWCVSNPRFMTYLALARGTPAAALVMQVSGGIAGFFQVATLPRFRRRGIAQALMQHALGDAQAFGATTAALTASAMAEGLYARLGFIPCCTFEQWMPGTALMSAICYPFPRAR